VTTMQYMFTSATAFNQALGGWNTDNVVATWTSWPCSANSPCTGFYFMFTYATAFNANCDAVATVRKWGDTDAQFGIDSSCPTWTISASRAKSCEVPRDFPRCIQSFNYPTDRYISGSSCTFSSQFKEVEAFAHNGDGRCETRPISCPDCCWDIEASYDASKCYDYIQRFQLQKAVGAKYCSIGDRPASLMAQPPASFVLVENDELKWYTDSTVGGKGWRLCV